MVQKNMAQIIRYLGMVCLLLLSGCAMSPGIEFSENDFDKQPDYDDAVVDVALIPITPETIQLQPKTASNAVALAGRVPNKKVPYKIGRQDVLKIIVWEHPELTIPAGLNIRTGMRDSSQGDGHRVSDNGTIFYPYVGVVNVINKTMEEVRNLLSRKLSNYIKQPQLDVWVVAFNSQKVLVSGAVAKPGNLPITDIPMTLADAVNYAGGPLKTADLQDVVVNRNNSKVHINLVDYYYGGNAEQNFLLQDGDVVYVPLNTDKKVYVMGEVEQPGVIPLVNGKLNLAEVMAESRIDQVTADPERIFILRNESGKPVAYHLDATKPNALILASKFTMQPLDIVFASTADISRWNRVLTQLLPTAQTIWYLGRVDESN